MNTTKARKTLTRAWAADCKAAMREVNPAVDRARYARVYCASLAHGFGLASIGLAITEAAVRTLALAA